MNRQLFKIPVKTTGGTGRNKFPSVLCQIINRHTMMTNKCASLLAALLFTIPVFGQLDVLAEWALNSDDQASPNTIANVQATDFQRGNGISPTTYSSLGVRTQYWPTDTEAGSVDYYEVCITPDPGITLEVNQLEFSESRTEEGIGAFEVRWSTDGFTTSNQLLGQVLPDNTEERKHTLSNLDIAICNGSQLCFRWYGYRAESDAGEWALSSNSLIIKGEKRTACAPPNTNGTLIATNITENSLTFDLEHGSGSGRVVVMREGSPVSSASAPCHGIVYNGDLHFGSGDQRSPGEFVVYAQDGAAGMNTSSFTVTGLSEGANYHLAVFEYNGTCYKQQGFLTEDEVTLCSNPNFVRNLIHSGTDSKISFMWDVPYCYDQILVVAGYSPITGFPTGTGSQYTIDPEFGQGDGGSDFGTEEYPVFLGSSSRFSTTDMQNNNLYHFTFFVRKGNAWVEAKRISTQPAQGCSDLAGGDNLFVNEIEYYTYVSGASEEIGIDEGIEIAGAAGVNLEAYEVHVYEEVLNVTKKATVRKIIPLSGKIEDQQNGMGAVWVPIPGIGHLTGWAIYNKVTETVVQFLSVARPLEAIDGVANGLVADQTFRTASNGYKTNVLEHPFSNPNKTMQLKGSGGCPGDFEWVSETDASRGGLNSTQAFVPLPIELLSFGAKSMDQQVLLSWQTLTEINNDYMAIERSVDGKDFEEVGVVKGAGTTFIPQSYELWDRQPYQGLNYYRLRQVDFDGTTTFSDIVSVVFKGKGRGVNVFPSLAQDFINIRLEQPTTSNGEIRIYDLNGKLRHRQVLENGSLSLGINISHLNPGHFIVQIERAIGVDTKRITKF
jgi:hypothetical protein